MDKQANQVVVFQKENTVILDTEKQSIDHASVKNDNSEAITKKNTFIAIIFEIKEAGEFLINLILKKLYCSNQKINS
jgi:hypothetical protein